MSGHLAPVEVRCEGLGRRYGAHQAVDDVSFTVPPGVVTALLGGNGAGKSTTLRMMLGLGAGTGATTYAGRPLERHARPERVVGAFLGAPSFHRARTARQHLRCLAAGSGRPAARVDDVLEALGLTSCARSRPRTFSTGMRQRLGVAAALLLEPSVLVLDEPVNGLDPHAVIGLRDLLVDHARRGGTVLMATHALGEAELVAERAVVMAAGRVVAEGCVADLTLGAATPDLLVSCDLPEIAAAHLRSRGGSVLVAGDALRVRGLSAREVAVAARDAEVLVWGLTPVRRSLEEFYVEAVRTVSPVGSRG